MLEQGTINIHTENIFRLSEVSSTQTTKYSLQNLYLTLLMYSKAQHDHPRWVTERYWNKPNRRKEWDKPVRSRVTTLGMTAEKSKNTLIKVAFSPVLRIYQQEKIPKVQSAQPMWSLWCSASTLHSGGATGWIDTPSYKEGCSLVFTMVPQSSVLEDSARQERGTTILRFRKNWNI